MSSMSASAIGISPARASIDYNNGAEGSIQYTVRNNNNVDIVAEISIGGDLAQYFTPSVTKMPLAPGQVGQFSLNVKIPKLTGIVGKQMVYVVVGETFPQQPGIGSRTEVIADIIINLPYPGKYVDATYFTMSNINKGEQSTLTFEATNRGTESTTVTAKLELTDRANVSLYNATYGPFTLQTTGDTHKETHLIPTTSYVPDKYNAFLSLIYDGPVTGDHTFFIIGKADVDLLDYNPKEVEYRNSSNTVPFSVTIQNLWNGKFTNVKAEVIIPPAKKIVTQNYNLEAFDTLVLTGYLEAENLALGTKQGTVTIFFTDNLGTQDSAHQKTFPISINITQPLAPKKEEGVTGSTTMFIGIGVFLIILVLINLYFILKNRKKKEQKQ